MATLTLTKTYDDFVVLSAVDLDNWLTDLETFFNSTKLSDGNIAAASISANLKVADNSITNAKVVDSAITSAKIADLGISEATDLASGAVTLAKVAALAISTAKLGTSSVVTAAIPDLTLSKIKQDSIVSASENPAQNTTTYTTETTMLTASITTSGRPVQALIAESTLVNTYTTVTQDGGSYTGAAASVGNLSVVTSFGNRIRIYRDAVLKSDFLLGMERTVSFNGSAGINSPLSCAFVESVAAGTYVYTVTITQTESGTSVGLNNCNLFVREL